MPPKTILSVKAPLVEVFSGFSSVSDLDHFGDSFLAEFVEHAWVSGFWMILGSAYSIAVFLTAPT